MISILYNINIIIIHKMKQLILKLVKGMQCLMPLSTLYKLYVKQ